MSAIPQERLPDELVAEIRLWQRRARQDINNLKSDEGMAWIKKNFTIINKPQYRDHVTELGKVRLP